VLLQKDVDLLHHFFNLKSNTILTILTTKEHMLDKATENFDAGITYTDQEGFAINLYSHIDQATKTELNRLGKECGILPTCKLGCYNCCGQYIIMNGVESHALAQYIKRHFSMDQIDALMVRTKEWHEWNDLRGDSLPAISNKKRALLSLPPHYCPLLVDGACSAYAMRPVTCRTHFVCSEPPACRSTNDADHIDTEALKLPSVMTVTNPFLNLLKEMNAKTEPDISQAIMLLPHWLAIEMGWEFAIN
jgi:Fe-S-cluster containining protein